MIQEGALPGDRLAGMNCEERNAVQGHVWAAYFGGKPVRVPIILGTNTRYFMLNEDANPEHISFEDYSRSPEIMFDAALKFQRWARFNILQDAELGLPERWYISPDFQNYYEANWFGCKVRYMDGQVPDTLPDFADCPERVMESGLPGPFENSYARALDYYDYFLNRAGRETFLGRPITANAPSCGMGTDGPFTVACNLFNPAFVCECLGSDPGRIVRLLEFITEATIQRIRAWRSLFRMPFPVDNWGIADDSIALISTRMYREFILPLHKRIYDTFATPVKRSIHLCGDATRHFKTMVDELQIKQFDTGFPVDFRKVREELGPDVRILGGPHVELLRASSPEKIRLEVKRILETGIAESGRFILREGNNLAPYTPLENTEAMYHAGIEFGKICEQAPAKQ